MLRINIIREEFGMVVFTNAATVDGYYNNTLDLVFNLIGALLETSVVARLRINLLNNFLSFLFLF